ncbi:unnamed protein product, partial [marine sediment metagenome]
MAGLGALRFPGPVADAHPHGYPYAQRRCGGVGNTFGASGSHSGNDASPPGDDHPPGHALADTSTHICGNRDTDPHAKPGTHAQSYSHAHAHAYSIAYTRSWAGRHTG